MEPLNMMHPPPPPFHGHPQDSMPNGVRPTEPPGMDGGFVSRMENLYLDERPAGKNDSPKYPKALDTSSSHPLYQQWTIQPKESGNGKRTDWTDVERKKVSQPLVSLEKKVRDTKKKTSVAEQLQVLSRLQRERVDDLIWQLERDDSRYQWTCEYAKIKGHEIRRKDYRGTMKTVEVIMVRRLRLPHPYKSPTSPISTKNPFANGFPNPEFRPYPETPGMGGQFGHGPAQGGFQPPMPAASQHSQGQHPPHRSDMMGTFPPQQRAHGGQPAMSPGQGGAPGPKANVVGPGIEIVRDEPPFHPRGASGYPQPKSPGNQNGPLSDLFGDFGKKPGKPHANMGASKQERRYTKSPKMPLAPELPIIMPDSSSDDDDSMRFREDEDSSATEDLPEERARYPRGCLHTPGQYPKLRKDEQPYRLHYRKQPQTTDERNRRRYSTSYVDVIPGNSMRPRREPGKPSGYDFTRARPTVIHDDPHLHLDEKLRERKRERDFDRQQRAMQDHILMSRLQMEAEENEWRHEELQERAEHLRWWELSLERRQREHDAHPRFRALPYRDPLPLRYGALEHSARDDLRLPY